MNTRWVPRLAVAVMALISTLLLAQGIAMAGAITFLDLTDTIALSDDTGRTSGFSCTGEACSVSLAAPTGTVAFVATIFPSEWVEPGTSIVSDRFCFTDCTRSVSGATITFESDTEPGSLGTCATCPAENGLVQVFAVFEWHDAAGAVIATDTIGFRSDPTETVPEPASALLLLAGFGGVVAVARRRARR